MVNSEKFGKRIQRIMDHYQVSASAFADAMGVGRSSISHILSGRNKPSLDFVMKITEAYPDAQLRWLLYGEGSFPNSEKEELAPVPSSNKKIEKPIPEEKQQVENENDLFTQNETTLNQKETIEQNEKVAPIAPTASPNFKTSDKKKIERIVIFYSDGSFSAYEN
ncbi:helix-turn-helix domain-containing protein [Aquimarina sp. 2-A2]|uniref:helix-turn-helix domain-containing protein n=1 Tax=Aquimarina sp. 2-A2 TaxID=3382644 RepID=UPI00387EFA3D